MTDEEKIELILQTVIKVSGVTEQQLINYSNGNSSAVNAVNNARGVYFILCREYGLHPTVYGSRVCRSRPSTLLTTRRYHNWYLSGDRMVISLIDKVRKELYADK